MRKVDLHFANASCAHCVRLVSRSLKQLEGVVSVDADRASARLVVGFDPTSVSVEAIREVMEGSGYPTRLLSNKVTPFPTLSASNHAA